VLAGMIDWGRGRGGMGLEWAWELLRLKRAATERLFPSVGGVGRGAVKVKREGVVGWVGELVDWGPEVEAETEDKGELDELRGGGVQEEGEELAEVGEFVDDVCGENGGTWSALEE
jgi:hypothetical protein